MWDGSPLAETTLETWNQVMTLNLTSAFLVVREAVRKISDGRIVTIASRQGADAAPAQQAAYAASKGAMVQFTKSLATAWAEDNIQVNCFLPGWIDTPLTVQARQQVPGLEEKVTTRTPAGRWGTPDDFAGIAVFLASPASDFITGTAIAVDGGFSVSVV